MKRSPGRWSPWNSSQPSIRYRRRGFLPQFASLAPLSTHPLLHILVTSLHRRANVAIAVVLFVATMALVPGIGTEFLPPPLEEGAIAIKVVRLPNASLQGSVKVGTFVEKEILKFPEVKTVVTKTGRAEISEDPMGPEHNDVLIMLHPQSQWTTGRSKAELVAAMQASLATLPGLLAIEESRSRQTMRCDFSHLSNGWHLKAGRRAPATCRTPAGTPCHTLRPRPRTRRSPCRPHPPSCPWAPRTRRALR